MARRSRRTARAGHVVALLTSATRYLAEPLAADLGIEHLLVSQLVVRDGRFTGEAVTPVCYGAGKIHWAERFAADERSISPELLLHRLDHRPSACSSASAYPRVVNPDPRLRRLPSTRLAGPAAAARRRIDGPAGDIA